MALVYFHGGGWVVGSIETHDGLARALAKRAGFVVVSVDYRLAPEHPFPAALEDAWTATKWVIATRRRAGARRRPIGVGGDSVGRQRSPRSSPGAVATTRSPIALQLLLYPVDDHDVDTPSYSFFSTGYGLTRDAMQWYWDQYLGGRRRNANPDASPRGARPSPAAACDRRDRGGRRAPRRGRGVRAAALPLDGRDRGLPLRRDDPRLPAHGREGRALERGLRRDRASRSGRCSRRPGATSASCACARRSAEALRRCRRRPCAAASVASACSRPRASRPAPRRPPCRHAAPARRAGRAPPAPSAGRGSGPIRCSLRIALASSGFWRSSAAVLAFWNQRRSNGTFSIVDEQGPEVLALPETAEEDQEPEDHEQPSQDEDRDQVVGHALDRSDRLGTAEGREDPLPMATDPIEAPARARRGARLRQHDRAPRARRTPRARGGGDSRPLLERLEERGIEVTDDCSRVQRGSGVAYTNDVARRHDRRRAAALPQRDRPLPAADGRPGGRAREADRARRQAREGADDQLEPAPRRLDREALPGPRALAARPDPGGDHRSDPRRREVRLAQGLQVLDLRHVVDQAGRAARRRQQGAHDPHPGARRRARAEGAARRARLRRQARARADRRGDRRSTSKLSVKHVREVRAAARAVASPRQAGRRRRLGRSSAICSQRKACGPTKRSRSS